MRMKKLAPTLAISLAVVEVVHFKEPATESKSPTVSAGNHTFFMGPHSHVDLETDTQPTTSAPLVASGGQQDQAMFRLQIVPQSSGFRLAGYPMPSYRRLAEFRPLSSLREPDYEIEPPQPMYGFAADIEELTKHLSLRLNLAEVQVAAIGRAAHEGKSQEIGGHMHAVRVFSRAQLEALGMSFKQPES